MARVKPYYSPEARQNISRAKKKYWADKRRAFQMGVQHAVIEELQKRKQENISWIPVPTEGQMDPESRTVAKLKNARPGTPSLTLIIDGRPHFLLIKKENGKLSRAQRELKEEIETAGGTWGMAKGLDAALRKLEEWKIIKPAD